MCNDTSCLGYLFLLVLVGFAVLIYFSLKTRKKFLSDNMELLPDQIWNEVSQRASSYGLSRADLLYGIHQDKTAATQQILVKNSMGEIISSVDRKIGVRELELTMGSEKYLIEYPMTWRKTAELKNSKGEVLASFERLPLSIKKHKMNLPQVGTLISQSPLVDFHYPFDYQLNGKMIGLTQSISQRPIGSIAVFPSNFSLLQKVFILAINAYGV